MALPPLNLQHALFYDSQNNVTVRTTTGGGGIGSSVNVTNFPAVQTVTGNVNVAISSVSVSNFPAVQPVIGNINVNAGSITVSNFPTLQNVNVASGNIVVTNLTNDPSTGTNQVTQTAALNQLHADLIAPLPAGNAYIGNVVVTNLGNLSTAANQATEIAALNQLHADLIAPLPAGNNYIGNVVVNNFPTVQPVTGNINVSAGSVSISNFPTVQPVTGNINVSAGSVTVSNLPGVFDSNVMVANASISSLGASPWYDTTGYGSISLQITSFEYGSIIIEGSNDGVTASPLLVLPVDDYSFIDSINKAGLYSIKTTSKYIRYNVQNNQGGSFGVYMLGRTGPGPSAADALSMAMGGGNNDQMMPLNVNFKSGLKIDTASGALVLADAINPNPAGLMYAAQVGTNTVIDTTGYNSINITTMAYAGSVTASNDGITWVALSGLAITGASTALVTAVTATASFTFPCMARYIRFTSTTAGQFTVYLRQQLFLPNYLTNPTTNLTQIAGAAVSATTAQLGLNMVQVGGTATVTGGLAGTLGIGGGSAVNVAPTYNFLGVAGIDSAGLTRRMLSDAAGRLVVTGSNPNINSTVITPTSSAIGAILGGMQNTAAMNVQDTTQFEGQIVAELLAQILVELRIANQQRYEMPYLLNNGVNNGMDPPEQFRADATIFAQ